jgi:hypothetical protein
VYVIFQWFVKKSKKTLSGWPLSWLRFKWKSRVYNFPKIWMWNTVDFEVEVQNIVRVPFS